MEMLKRWSTGSSETNFSSKQPRKPDQPDQSANCPGIFLRFKKSPSFPRNITGFLVPNIPQECEKPSSPKSNYEALSPARALAARERINKMRTMMRKLPDTHSTRCCAQRGTSALIDMSQERDSIIDANGSPSAQDQNARTNMEATIKPVAERIMAAIDVYLESGSATQKGHFQTVWPSPTTSDCEGSTAMEASLHGKALPKLDVSSHSASSSSSSSSSSLYSMASENTCQRKLHPEDDLWSTSCTGPTTTDTEPDAAADATLVQLPQCPCSNSEPKSFNSHDRFRTKADGSPERTPLPPTSEDTLYISLKPVRNTAAIKSNYGSPMTCQVCEQVLQRPPTTCVQHKAWMIHSGAKSAAHYIHVECLKDAKGVWERERGTGACAKCDAFKGILRGICGGSFEQRVERMESLVFGS
ncbi:hypothetical protein J1614_007621 [Plenodomus biglobosus]|nr:hypothetical protein J1614_007621 [Plenodomus biglobosus]